MALNIPMPDSPGSSLLKGLDTGSSMMARMMQPVIERERMKQQQAQFVQDYALKKQAEGRANALMPYMVQQYQDTHKTALNDQQMKALYTGLMQDAMKNGGAMPSSTGIPGTAPPMGGGSQPAPAPGGMAPPSADGSTPQPGVAPPESGGMPPQGNAPAQIGGQPNVTGTLPVGGQAPAPAPIGQPTNVPNLAGAQEQEVRPGNPKLARLDAVAGLIPGVPKAVQHITNGIIYTTYPSGRMTAQKVEGAQSPGEKTVSAREASKIRDSATALVNSANLVNQGYDLLDNNPNLTGPGNVVSAIPIPFSGGSKLNLSSKPELGEFTTVAGKLQAELGKYASQRGGVQAVKWAAGVKPSAFNSEGYNYGMFNGIQKSIENDYKALNEQYKANTGQNLPVALPDMKTTRGKKGTGTGTATATTTGTGTGKIIKYKMINGQLVKE